MYVHYVLQITISVFSTLLCVLDGVCIYFGRVRILKADSGYLDAGFQGKIIGRSQVPE